MFLGDRERAPDHGWRARGAYDRGELRFQGVDLGRQFDRWEQLGALGNDGRDGLRFLRREPAGTDVVEQVGIGQRQSFNAVMCLGKSSRPFRSRVC